MGRGNRRSPSHALVCSHFVKTSARTIKLEPGDIKEVAEENAEDETPILPGGDLYPAGVIE